MMFIRSNPSSPTAIENATKRGQTNLSAGVRLKLRGSRLLPQLLVGLLLRTPRAYASACDQAGDCKRSAQEEAENTQSPARRDNRTKFFKSRPEKRLCFSLANASTTTTTSKTTANCSRNHIQSSSNGTSKGCHYRATLLLFIVCSSNLIQVSSVHHYGQIASNELARAGAKYAKRVCFDPEDRLEATFDSIADKQRIFFYEPELQRHQQQELEVVDTANRGSSLTRAKGQMILVNFQDTLAPSEEENSFAASRNEPASFLSPTILTSAASFESPTANNASYHSRSRAQSRSHSRPHRHHYNRNYRPSTSRKQETQQKQQSRQLTETSLVDSNQMLRRENVDPSTRIADGLRAAASVSDRQAVPSNARGLRSKASRGQREAESRERQEKAREGVFAAPSEQTSAAVSIMRAHHQLAEPRSGQQTPMAVGSFGAARGGGQSALQQSGASVEQSSARVVLTASSAPPVPDEGQWIPIVTNVKQAKERANRVNKPLVDTTAPTMTTSSPAMNPAHGAGKQVSVPREQESSAFSDTLARSPSLPAESRRLAKTRREQMKLNGPLAANRARPAVSSLGRPSENGAIEASPARNNSAQRQPHELQQAADSYAHNHWQHHSQLPPRPYYSSNNNKDRFQLERHPSHPTHQPRWRHQNPGRRRPRLNSNQGGAFLHVNSIEHDEIDFDRRNKIYKRVLLCDKTLVSLDYIRSLEAEPRPDDKQPLSEFEINEINENFISDFDGAYETLSRSASSESKNTSDTHRASPISGGTGANELLLEEEQSANRATAAAAALLTLDRRALLSDEDPLIRCDMWDLEKGLKSRKPPLEILRMAVKANFETVRDAINRCRQLSERTMPPDDEPRDGPELMSTEDLVSLFSIKRGLLPGTKWCGLGDQADSYNDLGPKHRIDICCRAHDHCPIRSKPFRNDYGVLNIGLYTKSHCDCDADFYRCLREARSRTADMLGNLYFNVMKLQCMREERLKVCRELKPIALGFERCVRYEESPTRTVFKFTTPPVPY